MAAASGGHGDRVLRLPRLEPRDADHVRLNRSLHSGRVAMGLRQAIILGELPPGTSLVEARLADELGVSRGPIRSALTVLEQEGLVVSLPNGRMLVHGFGEDRLRELFAVRYEFEALAIRWSIARRADFSPLTHALREMAAEGASTARLVDLDIRFHRELMNLAANPFLLRSWVTFAPLLHTIITIGNRQLREQDSRRDFERILDSHQRIVKALNARQGSRAQSVLREQFDITLSMLQLKLTGC